MSSVIEKLQDHIRVAKREIRLDRLIGLANRNIKLTAYATGHRDHYPNDDIKPQRYWRFFAQRTTDGRRCFHDKAAAGR